MHNFTIAQICCDKEAIFKIFSAVFPWLTATSVAAGPKYGYAHSTRKTHSVGTMIYEM